MMTFLRLIYISDGYVTYEYGKSKDSLIGTVSMSISDNKDCKFVYYEKSEIKQFCSHTSHALIMINKFIKTNDFPKEYTFAC